MDSLAKAIARWIEKRSVHKGKIPYRDIRDICNLQTGEELNDITLTILTDMVIGKLPEEMVEQ